MKPTLGEIEEFFTEVEEIQLPKVTSLPVQPILYAETEED